MASERQHEPSAREDLRRRRPDGLATVDTPDAASPRPVGPRRPPGAANVRLLQQSLGNARLARLLSPPVGPRSVARDDAPRVATSHTTGSGSEGGQAASEPPAQEAAPATAPRGFAPGPPAPPDSGKGGPAARSAAASQPGLSLQRQEEAEDDEPTEAEKKEALRLAEAAEARAGEAKGKNDAEVAKEKAAKADEKQKSQAAKQEAAAKKGAAKKPAGPSGKRAPARPKTEAAPPPGAAGTAPLAGKAPSSPQEDPAFAAVKARAKKAAAAEKKHAPAAKKAKEAQASSEPPETEVLSKGQARQAGKMEQAPAPGFDKAAFKARLMERIQQTAPKTMQEADNFESSGKMSGVKDQLSGEVESEKQASSQPMEEAKDAEPDTSGIEPKPVKSLPEAGPGDKAAIPNAKQAAPKQKGKGEVEAPLEQEAKSVDAQMKDADVTEEQLANSNEPEFNAALGAKKEAQAHAKEAPKQFREEEKTQIAQAQDDARQTADGKLEEMHGEKASVLQQVAGDQVKTKGIDEQKRAKVASDINAIYEKTKSKVDTTLGELDGKVGAAFDAGAEAARTAFESYVEARMNAYKQRRYGGWLGWAKWAKDKLLGMPGEVNAFYAAGRRRYIKAMDSVLDRVATIVEAGINQAKAEIAAGRQEIEEYVAKLPQDLQQVGQEAAGEIQGKFDNLEQSVDAKQDELINTLAQKYNERLEAIDSRIEELKAANKGLVQKAVDAVAGVVRTILQLKDMLLSVLAAAAGAVKKIIKDPIGFLGNLIGAVKSGLESFVSNIGKHLKKGLMTWLFGALGSAGLILPKVFDVRGILSLVMQVVGLTWDFIRSLAVKALGEKVVGYLEQAFDIFVTIKEKGLEGLWDFIKDKLGDLQAMVMDQIQDMVIVQVIKAGIQWLIGIVGGPAGAFIKAAKAIYDIVMWFVNNGKRVLSLVQSIIGSITKIASGNIGGAAQYIEQSLGKAVPIVISFLASLLGLGNIGVKVRDILQTVRKPVEGAINWVLSKAKAFATKFMGKVTGKDKDKPEAPTQAEDDTPVGPADPKVREDALAEADRRLRQKKISSIDDMRTEIGGVAKMFKPRGLKSLGMEVVNQDSLDLQIVASASAPEKRSIRWNEIFDPVDPAQLEFMTQPRDETHAAISVNGKRIGQVSTNRGRHAEMNLLRSNWDKALAAAQEHVDAGRTAVVAVAINRAPCGDCSEELMVALNEVPTSLKSRVRFVLAPTGLYEPTEALTPEEIKRDEEELAKAAERIGMPAKTLIREGLAKVKLTEDATTMNDLRRLAQAGWDIQQLLAREKPTPGGSILAEAAHKIAVEMGRVKSNN